MDLTLSNKIVIEEFLTNKHGNQSMPAIDPSDEQTYVGHYIERDLPYDLDSMERCLLGIHEVIRIPLDRVGIFCIRSTWARHGLLAAPTVAYPGWEGELTLEVFNSSMRALKIRPGDRIGTLIYLHAIDLPRYVGQYQNQVGITLPKEGSI